MVNVGPRPKKKPSFLGPFHAARELGIPLLSTPLFLMQVGCCIVLVAMSKNVVIKDFLQRPQNRILGKPHLIPSGEKGTLSAARGVSKLCMFVIPSETSDMMLRESSSWHIDVPVRLAWRLEQRPGVVGAEARGQPGTNGGCCFTEV